MIYRTILLPALAVLSLGLLAGCGADGEPETPTRAQAAVPMAQMPPGR
jgi:hypothetical protein